MVLLPPAGLTVLPAHLRLRTPEDHRATSRRGRRAGSRTVVVHLLAAAPQVVDVSPNEHPRVGFVVSKAVGTAVVRNRVKRRLRHAMAERIDRLAPGDRVVVRAQAPAADATHAELAADLDRCLQRLLTPEPAGQSGRVAR